LTAAATPAAGEELLLRKFFKPTRASFLNSGAATPAAGAPPEALTRFFYFLTNLSHPYFHSLNDLL
jgi:hypothetical protein